MNHYGGPSKSNSIFNPKKKGLKNKNDKNKFGTSSSNNKVVRIGGPKPSTWLADRRIPEPFCMNCSGTAKLNSENIEL